MNRKITTKLAPDLVQKGSPFFKLGEFQAAIWNKGYFVYHDKMMRCPCQSKGSNSPLPSCENCGGYGWVLVERLHTKMLITAINLPTQFKEWSLENVGRANFSSLDPISFMDKIVLLDSKASMTETLFPRIYLNAMFAFTIYEILEIEYIYAFDSVTDPLIQLLPADYAVFGDRIVFKPGVLVEGTTVSIRYTHRPQFHVTDINHDVRYSQSLGYGNIKEMVAFPTNFIGTRSHLIIDKLDYQGTNLIDNTQEVVSNRYISYYHLDTGPLIVGENIVVTGLVFTEYAFFLPNNTSPAVVDSVYQDPDNPTTQLIINISVAPTDGFVIILYGILEGD